MRNTWAKEDEADGSVSGGLEVKRNQEGQFRGSCNPGVR